MTSRVFAIDPGYEISALVVFDGREVLSHRTMDNAELLRQLRDRPIKQIGDTLVIEQIAAMGMAVGEEVFETVFWSGRFAEMWASHIHGLAASVAPFARVKRHAVKMHLCGHMQAKDANIRQVLIDRFGPSKEKAIGTTKRRGPLYGIKGDEWSALAVAVTYWDQQFSIRKAG